MRRFTIASVLLCVLACLISIPALANELTPPWDWVITSDFGPRFEESPFHKGIDYGGLEGEDINAVDTGTIVFIGYDDDDGGGHFITVKGNNHGLWWYFHLFNDEDLPITSGNWQLADATLEEIDINTGDVKESDESRVIILWSDSANNRAEKVLCLSEYGNRRVRVGDKIIKGTDGNYKRSRGFVITESETSNIAEPIAPVGTSAGDYGPGKPHLHLGYNPIDNNRRDNPLLYLKHPPDELPTATTENPPDGHRFDKGETNKYPVKVKVDSTQGLDLDKVDLFIYKERKRDEKHKIQIASSPDFNYGGRPGEDGNVTDNDVFPGDGNEEGVHPLSTTAGDDMFVLNVDFSALGLSEGEHYLVVGGKDINGNALKNVTRTFVYGCDEVTIDDGNECTRDWCEPDPDPTAVTVHNDPMSPEDIGYGNKCENKKIVPKSEEEIGPCFKYVDGEVVSAQDDNNECTKDSCDPETGEISNIDMTEEEIGEGNVCMELLDGRTIIVSKGEAKDGFYYTCDPVTGKCKQEPYPGGGHADDNAEVGGTPYTAVDVPDTATGIGVFSNGFHVPMSSLAGKLGNGYVPVDIGFSPDIVKEHPLLVIPSGGLYGLENSALFRQKLDEYVRRGGTLLVFSQHHGYEFSALPVPQEEDGTFRQVKGYGWDEDQNCFADAVYIDTWHQVLSGQNRATPTLNVDGYFLSYPSDTQVILRRTANGQPAMIVYPHGNGTVMVTSMYSDFAWSHGQASEEEIALVRDMISWAKKPALLPGAAPGGTVSFDMDLLNESTVDAYGAALKVMDADWNMIQGQTAVANVPAGHEGAVPFSYPTNLSSPLGIWHVNYGLLDSAGNTIQQEKETNSGRFAVSVPLEGGAPDKPIWFYVSTDSQTVAYGAPFTYTFHVVNNTDEERDLTIKNYFRHTYRGQSWSITAAPNAETTLTASDLFLDNIYLSETMASSLYDEAGSLIGEHELTFKAYRASVDMTASTDKGTYTRGETVTLTLGFKTSRYSSFEGTVNVKVTDPLNSLIYSGTVDVSVAGTSSRTLSFELPADAEGGYYIISAVAYDPSGEKAGSGTASFDVPEWLVSVASQLPQSLVSGRNAIVMELKNLGTLPVSSGVLDVSLEDPDGAVLYSGSHSFTIDAGGSTTLEIAVDIPPLKFGDYTFTYTESDEGGTKDPVSLVIPNSIVIYGIDKTTYRIRETAELTPLIANTGKFNLKNMSVTVSMPDAGYSRTDDIASLGTGGSETLSHAITMPETLSAGQYAVDVSVALPSGSTTARGYEITIPESWLRIGYPGPDSVSAGDTITLTVENTGGVDTVYASETHIKDIFGVFIYNGNTDDSILAGEQKTLTDIQIPYQTASGKALIDSVVTDSETGGMYRLQRLVDISGLSVDLQTRTDREAYLSTEAVTGITDILSGQPGIEGGSLNIEVSKVEPAINDGTFKHYVGGYGTGDGQFNYPMGIAVGPDGSLYVADTYNNRVQKFDKDGKFVTKWGSYCRVDARHECNGQFISPRDIAVGPDGTVYVLDGDQYRVQKFDSDGNFILKWGSYGASDGQFKAANSIDVGQDGNIYVADRFNMNVQKFDKDGNFILKWGSYGTNDGQFYFPGSLAVSSDGMVYVTDGTGRVQKFNDKGNFIKKWSASNGRLAVGPYGYVYIRGADYYSAIIRKYDSDGNHITNLRPGLRLNLSGVDVDSTGSVYVSELKNHHIRKLTISKGGDLGTLFKTTVPITQEENIEREYTTDIGQLDATGKLYLRAELENELGQKVAEADHQFYIVQGGIVLISETDKKIYRPGETVKISGEVKNLLGTAYNGLSMFLQQGDQSLYTASFDIPAGGSYPFSVTTTAPDEGVYVLTGTVKQGSVTLYEITDRYETANPVVSATVSAPDVAGGEPFDITVDIRNEGKVDALVGLTSEFGEETLTVPAGGTTVLQYSGQITEDAAYTFTFTGDLEETVTKTVSYGLSASIEVQAQSFYPEGLVEMPFTVTNTGQLDAPLSVEFTLAPSGISETRTYYIPSGGGITDSLYYDLKKGDYTLLASASEPDASAEAAFSVAELNRAELFMTIGTVTDGQIPVSVDATNSGWNTLEGSVLLRAFDSEGTQVWSNKVAVNELLPSDAQSLSFSISPAALGAGTFTIEALLLDSSNAEISNTSASLSIQGPVFEMVQVPPYRTYALGQSAEMIFAVRNTGDIEGPAELSLSAYDLVDVSHRAWIAPNEVSTFTFGFDLPDDLEEKDYFADWTMMAEDGEIISSGQVKYHLAGIYIDVEASFDKQAYHEGDTAELSIDIENLSYALPGSCEYVEDPDCTTGTCPYIPDPECEESGPVTLDLFARVNYAGYNGEQSFTLEQNNTLTFDVPLTRITGEKIFYGIYHRSGRSIYLNTLYVREAGGVVSIATDKQVYNPLETVTYTVSSEHNGTLTVGVFDHLETTALEDSMTGSVQVPQNIAAGTYTITAQLVTADGEVYSATLPIDVAGIRVKVLECENDKGKYASFDKINTRYTIWSNSDIAATLKAWVLDPEGNYIPVGEDAITLLSTDNLLFEGEYAFSTNTTGIHRLVYGIYRGDILLASGSEAFDVGDAVLLGISTDRTDYTTHTEPVTVSVNMFGTAGGSLAVQLDGSVIKTEQVSLDGFEDLEFTLDVVEPGEHTLSGELLSGGLKSTKETSFRYGTDLPDLVVGASLEKVAVDSNNIASLGALVFNQGRTLSGETAVSFFNGEDLIKSEPVGALNADGHTTIPVGLNVLGKAGLLTITGVVDPDNMVVEYNEKNNVNELTFNIPEATLFTASGMVEYRVNEAADIISSVTNLSTENLAGYGLRTAVTSEAGAMVYNTTSVMDALPAMSTSNIATYWSIPLETEEGIYRVDQYVLSPSGDVVAASSTSFEVIAADFSMSFSPETISIKQGEKAVYSGVLEPLGGFDDLVELNIEDVPGGATVSIDPGSLVPPGTVALEIFTNNGTQADLHEVRVVAQGGGIVHDALLTLDIAAFTVSADKTEAELKQLESAFFNISTESINGYEGSVDVSIDGVPFGVMASWDKTSLGVPDKAKLVVLTSKYAVPGTYELTVTGDDGLVKHEVPLTLTIEANPEIAAGIIMTQGPGPKNEAWVRGLNLNLMPVLELVAFDTRYGASATSADIDGNGYDEILVGMGPDPKNSAIFGVFNRNGYLVSEFTAFDTKYGLTLSSGDLDGDWTDEVIVGMGPDPKNPAVLKVMRRNGNGFAEVASETAYKYLRYGINTAVGDVDGDNVPEIITAPGPGPENPAWIKVWNIEGDRLVKKSEFNAFGGFYGANVTVGDIDGDGIGEIIAGTGPDPKNPAIIRAYKADGTMVLELIPYGFNYKYGVNVAAVDMDNDGVDEIITGLGPGPQNPAWVKIFRANGTEVTGFLAYPEKIKYGVKVFRARPGE